MCYKHICCICLCLKYEMGYRLPGSRGSRSLQKVQEGLDLGGWIGGDRMPEESGLSLKFCCSAGGTWFGIRESWEKILNQKKTKSWFGCVWGSRIGCEMCASCLVPSSFPGWSSALQCCKYWNCTKQPRVTHLLSKERLSNLPKKTKEKWGPAHHSPTEYTEEYWRKCPIDEIKKRCKNGVQVASRTEEINFFRLQSFVTHVLSLSFQILLILRLEARRNMNLND